MIAILHGYLLEGSGSNLWTRAIVHALCKKGQTVHLLSQENHPETYPFIAEAYRYTPKGDKESFFTQPVKMPGKCILHKPVLGNTLPVFVWDKYEEFSNVVPMTDLPDSEIERYLQINTTALARIVKENNIKAVHANHAVLMPEVAQREFQNTGIPFSIMPHGSALEFAVKKDKRFFNFAVSAMKKTGRIFAIGAEMRNRVSNIFEESIPEVNQKLTDLNLGVETELFLPVNKKDRRASIAKLAAAIPKKPGGKTPAHLKTLREGLSEKLTQTEFQKLLTSVSPTSPKTPDEDFSIKILEIDWKSENILLFVGRLIESKGIQNVVAALPLVLQKHPKTRLIIVGHGPLRETLEAWIICLELGKLDMAEKISKPFLGFRTFWNQASTKDKEDYLRVAKTLLSQNRVIFTGYLVHKELRYLFPSCDAALFPSVVREAGPLVFLESLACGCFPLGTYFGGMAASIDSLKGIIPDTALNLMKLPEKEEEVVGAMAKNVTSLLDTGNPYGAALRKVALEKYDWKNVAQKFWDTLKTLNNR